MNVVEYSWEQFDRDVKKIVRFLKKRRVKAIYAIPNGGLILGVTLSKHLEVPLYLESIDLPDKEVAVVDDIADSGETLLNLPEIDKYTTAVLVIKDCSKYQPDIHCYEALAEDWIRFPWETKNNKMMRDRDA